MFNAAAMALATPSDASRLPLTMRLISLTLFLMRLANWLCVIPVRRRASLSDCPAITFITIGGIIGSLDVLSRTIYNYFWRGVRGLVIRWFQTRNGLRFYGVADPITGDRPDAVVMIRKGRIERIRLGPGVIEGLTEVSYAELPPAWRDAVHDYFWKIKR